VEKQDGGDKYKTPQTQYKDVELGPLPVAPDGGIAAGAAIGMPPPVPEATPQQFVCLRGPCRHYWELVTDMGSGNPASTWDPINGLKDELGQPLQIPRQINRSCLAQLGMETELTDDCVFDCNRWDPLSRSEIRKLERRRRRHFRRFPGHKPEELPTFKIEPEEE
jgi:hypothetical protein